MTISKEEVLELVNQLPDPVEVEELIYRLYLREKLAAAEKAIAQDRTLSSEEMRAQATSWRLLTDRP
jgi:hypothetical protein